MSALLLPSFLPPSDPVTENVLRCDTTEAAAAAPSSAREDEADGGRGGGQGREPEAIAIARRVRFSLGDSVAVGGQCWIGIRFHVRRPSPSPPLKEVNRDRPNLSSKKPPRSDDKIFHPLMSGKEVFHPPSLTRTSKEGLWQQQRERQERDDASQRRRRRFGARIIIIIVVDVGVHRPRAQFSSRASERASSGRWMDTNAIIVEKTAKQQRSARAQLRFHEGSPKLSERASGEGGREGGRGMGTIIHVGGSRERGQQRNGGGGRSTVGSP